MIINRENQEKFSRLTKGENRREVVKSQRMGKPCPAAI